MNVTDIPGTVARVRHASRPNPDEVAKYFNPIDYRDVTHCDFKTKRSTNPLSPTYVHRDDDGELKEIGVVKGSYPVVLPPPREDQNFVKTSLTTTDIHLCAIGTKGLGNFHTRIRREYKNTNVTKDIPGADPGSLKKGPETIRSTHPLDPVY